MDAMLFKDFGLGVHFIFATYNVCSYVLGARAKKWPKGPFASNKTAKVNHCQSTEMPQFFNPYHGHDRYNIVPKSDGNILYSNIGHQCSM